MQTRQKDRRRSFRVPVPATAFLWQKSRFAGGYAVNDISIGGCSIAQGPFCDLGQRFDLTLQVRGAPGAHELRCPATVVRREGDRVGLRFLHSERVEDRIHDLVLRCLEQGHDRRGEVLLVNPRPEFMGPVMRELEAAGHRVHLACTPLEAVWILEHSAEHLSAAVVSHRLGGSDGRELVRYLADRYPNVHRVLLTHDSRLAETPPSYVDAVIEGSLEGVRLESLFSPGTRGEPLSA